MKIDINNYEYNEIIKDILNSREFKKIEACPHHKINRLEHSKRVSYFSYKVCKSLNLDYVSAARAGLLHDFFLNKYNNNWKESFEAKDFDKMEKYMKKINNLLTKTLPLENTIKNARTIENLHELIKNNGKSFELSDEEMQLAELLG